MAERIAYLEAVVGADVTAFRRGMQQVRNETGFLSETMAGIAGVGRAATLAFTAPVVALGTAAVNVASDFDASMRNINSIANLTESEFASLTQQVLDFGSTTRSGAIDSSTALYTVFSAGITDIATAFNVMEVAVMTAEAGLSDLEVTTESLVATTLAYGDTSEAAVLKTSNALTAMVQVGVGSMENFAGAMGNVTPTAAAMGMSIEELYGDIAYLTQRGLSASKATTSLNSALTSLAKPTTAMKAAFDELGAGSAEELIQKFGGVNGAIEALISTTDGTQESLQALFSNIRGARAINMFANDLEGWKNAMNEFNNSLDGATMRAWEEQSKSFAATFDRMKSAIQFVAITIGSAMMPVLTPLIENATSLLLSIKDLNPSIIQTGLAFTATVAAAAPLVWLFGSIVTPIGILAGAVVGLAVAFATNFGGIRDTVSQAVQDITGDLQPLANTVEDIIGTLFPDTTNDTYNPIGTLSPVDIAITDLIAVSAPSSLWDIFVDNGYGDYFSWEEFQKNAQSGGWTGGVVEVGDEIEIDMSVLGGKAATEVNEAMVQAYEGLNMMPFTIETNNVSIDTSFQDRVQIAIDEYLPIIQSHITTIWNSVTSFIDTNAGNALSHIAGWFSGSEDTGGDTPIYRAFSALLQGDISRAINELIPGLGADVENFGANFAQSLQDTFPQLSSAISNLLSNVGEWLINEGIPTLSRAAGTLVSSLGAAIMSGIGGAIGSLSGGGLSDAGSAVSETVITPFTEGFNEGLANAGIDGQNPIENLLIGLAGAIGTAAIVNFAIFKSPARAVMMAFTLAFSGLKMTLTAVGIVAKLGTSLASAALSGRFSVFATNIISRISSSFTGSGIGSKFVTAGQTIVSTAGRAISAAARAAGSAASWAIGAASSIVTSVGNAISTKALALTAGSPFATSVVTGIGSALSGAASAISAATGWIASIGSSVLGAITSVISSPITIGVIVGSLAYFAIPDSVKESIRGAIRGLLDGAFGEGTFDGMLTGFEQSMYALMAHLSYLIGHFNPEFNEIGDNFVSMIDQNIADRFGLDTGQTLIREYGVNPLFTDIVLDDNTDLVSRINEALAGQETITGGDLHAIFEANLLLDAQINDTNMEGLTISGYSSGDDYFRDLAQEQIQNLIDAGVNLDPVTVDWSQEQISIDVAGFMPDVNVSGALEGDDLSSTSSWFQSISTVTPADIETAKTDAQESAQQIQTAVQEGIKSGLTGGVSASGGIDIDTGNMTDLVTGNIFDTSILSDKGASYNTELDTQISSFGQTIMNNIGEGNTLDANAIIDNFLVPLENAWVAQFSEGSPMSASFKTLSVNFISGLTQMGQQITVTSEIMSSILPGMSNIVLTALASMNNHLQSSVDRIWNLQQAISSLLVMEGSLNVQVNVSGGVSVDGSHKGGLSYVPQDGYIAELHKGERVLTAEENKAYSRADTGAISTSNTNNNNISNVKNEIHIHGADNVDSILSELNRRGIYL